jgi:hypothetical protein
MTSAFCFLDSVVEVSLYKSVLVVCATLSSKRNFPMYIMWDVRSEYTPIAGLCKMPNLENNDLPARTLILPTMVMRLCGTGLIEFPPHFARLELSM